ncbi:P-loop NTPase fold protein [Actinosynnema sp. NPDC051121]
MAEGPTGRRRALLVSTGEFTDGRLRPLPSARADGEALAAVLSDPDVGGFDVEWLAEPTADRARRAIASFFRDASRDDVLLFYYTGHGLKTDDGVLHLAAADTESSLLSATAIPATFLSDVVGQSRAANAVVILDCSYSGSYLEVGRIAVGQAVLASSRRTEYAFESVEGGRPGSRFTAVLLEGLATGNADLDGDGLVEIRELYSYIHDGMRSSDTQTPVMSSTLAGPLYIAGAPGGRRAPTAPPTEVDAPLPPEPEFLLAEPAEPDADVDWSTDAPATRDDLNRASLADVLALRLREVRRDEPGTSFLVHVDGAWGTGKSSLLNFLGRRLEREFTVVRFDAWRQSRIAPPWWTLLGATRKEISRQRGFWRSAWLRLAETFVRARRSGAPYVLAFVLVAVAAAAVALLWPRGTGGDLLTNAAKGVTAVAGAVTALWVASRLVSRFLLWDSARGARLFEQSTANPMDEVAAHFGWMLGKSAKPVLFFIDDLDRCPDTYVVELLDSVQTLIRDSGTAAYFVVAADGVWLRTSYETAYKAFGDSVALPGYPLGHLFLDKLFQLTVPVPVPTAKARSVFLDRLLRVESADGGADTESEVREARRRIAEGEEAEILQVLDEASDDAREDLVTDAALALNTPRNRKRTEHALRGFLPLLDANPRNVKKFLNTYSVLRSVRVLENNTVASDVLALWTIVRVRWPAMADHLEVDPEAVRGVVEPLWISECFPEHLRELAADEDFRAVVLRAPLTPRLIRQCCGTED